MNKRRLLKKKIEVNRKSDNASEALFGRIGRKKNMLTLLFIICFFAVFGKLLMFGIKAAWGISKFLLTVVLLPVILIGMVVGGMMSVAFPILIVVGIVGLLMRA